MNSILLLLVFVGAASCYMVTPDPKCVKEFRYDGVKVVGCSMINAADWWCSLHEDYRQHEEWLLCDQKRVVYETKKDNFHKVFERVKALKDQLNAASSTSSCQCTNAVKDVKGLMNVQYRMIEDHKRRIDGLGKLAEQTKTTQVIVDEIRKIWGPVLRAAAHKTVAAPVRKVIPNGYWVKSDHAKMCHNGVCYEFYKKRVTHKGAVANCANHEYELVIEQNQAEHNLIWSTAAKYGLRHYWVSGTDAGHEGRWTDQYGKNLPYKYFGRGNPNNAGGNQNCVWVGWQGSPWDDLACHVNNGFVCKQKK